MFVVINLKPVDDSPESSTIILHPLLASDHLDDFSLPISFPVNAQAQLHVQDGQPVIYCQHPSCDVLQNGIPATKRPRRVYTGDSIQILSSDAPTTTSVTYVVQVAYLSFSSDLREEVSVDLPRLQSAAALALSTETSSAFPLMLPLEGKLPTPAPEGTNWDGVRELVTDVRVQSLKASVQRREQLKHRPRTSSLPPVRAQELGSSLPPRTYAELVADLCPPSLPVGSDAPSAITRSALEEGPSTSSHSPALDTSTSPFTSVLGQNSSPASAGTSTPALHRPPAPSPPVVAASTPGSPSTPRIHPSTPLLGTSPSMPLPSIPQVTPASSSTAFQVGSQHTCSADTPCVDGQPGRDTRRSRLLEDSSIVSATIHKRTGDTSQFFKSVDIALERLITITSLVHEETESLADSERDEPRRNATKRSDVGPQTPAEGDETVTRFYRFISSTLKTKTRRKTGEVYKGTDERWQCRFCNGYYTGHPENRSNLALHLNVASNKNCCKKIYDPEDKSLRGLYKQPTKEDAAAPGQHSPAGTASSTSTSLLPGRGQQRLDMWRASQKTEMTKQKVEEVRRLVLQWVIMDNQPFVQPTSPHFQAILLALNPAVGPALLSPRQLRRDLELAYGHVVQDAVAYLRKHGIRFSVSHDAWTSPSRRYTFLSFVVSYVDVDWSFKQFILAFDVLDGPHIGAILA
ncbi:hypothetical protein CF328_g5896 [Tilletia controversa]|nr:hypothetical protein CF328_g5896 [Tilletia controversa]